MEFNFNIFFGLESQIEAMGSKMLLGLFAILMYGQVILIVLSGYARRFNITIFKKEINVLILTLGLTTLFGTSLSLMLFYLINDCSRVKILYCWIVLFVSMFYFSIFNYKKVKSVF